MQMPNFGVLNLSPLATSAPIYYYRPERNTWSSLS